MPRTLTVSRDQLLLRNQIVTRALDAVRDGDVELAQQMLADQDDTLTLDQVLSLYQSELEARTLQLEDAQQRMEYALDWFSNLFRMLPMAALLVDAQGLIFDANARALDELALSRALRSVALPLRRLMASPADEQRLVLLLAQLSDAGGSLGLDDLALQTLDGQPRWADLRVTRMPPRHGQPAQRLYLCVFNDRTARVEAQRARDAAAQAEHAREVAETASLTKTALLSRVSHELRTPLNAVLGFSHLMLTGPLAADDQSRRWLQLIHDAGEHLLALVDDVLQLNRVESGKLPLTPTAVPLAELAQELLELQALAAQTLQLRLELVVEQPAQALADARRCREIVLNLLNNAIKYNRREGWVRLRVGCDLAAPSAAWGGADAGAFDAEDAAGVSGAIVGHRAEARPAAAGAQAWVAVEDSGIGLNDDQLAHLFEPFNRLGADAGGAVPGHGLGLCIARSLAQAMGGSLSAASAPGAGSCFTLRLPLAL